MRTSIFLILVMGLHVSVALYTPQCKEAEKSNLHFMRLLENMNCTLLMGQRKVQKGFEHFHNKFKTGVDGMKSYLGLNRIEPVKEDKLDYDINIRFLNGKDEAQKITKREADDGEVAEEATQSMNEEDPEQTTIGIGIQNIFFAPIKCNNGHKYIHGRCRQAV